MKHFKVHKLLLFCSFMLTAILVTAQEKGTQTNPYILNPTPTNHCLGPLLV